MTIKNKQLAYVDEGNGFPILLGHSYLFDHRMWRPQINELKRHYRVIATDLWGHGHSDLIPDENSSVYDIADDMAQLLKNLGLKKYALVGLSIGGMWATKLTLDHPQEVSALALFGSHVGCEPKEKKIEYQALLKIMQELGAFEESLAQSLLPFFFAPHTFAHKKELPQALKAALMATPPKNLPSILRIGALLFEREDLLSHIKNINCPTMVVVGKNDVARPPSESREMAALLKNCEYHEIENAGHIVSLEEPDQVNDLIMNFLASNVPKAY